MLIYSDPDGYHTHLVDGEIFVYHQDTPHLKSGPFSPSDYLAQLETARAACFTPRITALYNTEISIICELITSLTAPTSLPGE